MWRRVLSLFMSCSVRTWRLHSRNSTNAARVQQWLKFHHPPRSRSSTLHMHPRETQYRTKALEKNEYWRKKGGEARGERNWWLQRTVPAAFHHPAFVQHPTFAQHSMFAEHLQHFKFLIRIQPPHIWRTPFHHPTFPKHPMFAEHSMFAELSATARVLSPSASTCRRGFQYSEDGNVKPSWNIIWVFHHPTFSAANSLPAPVRHCLSLRQQPVFLATCDFPTSF